MIVRALISKSARKLMDDRTGSLVYECMTLKEQQSRLANLPPLPFRANLTIHPRAFTPTGNRALDRVRAHIPAGGIAMIELEDSDEQIPIPRYGGDEGILVYLAHRL
jgi:hypothetical protein